VQHDAQLAAGIGMDAVAGSLRRAAHGHSTGTGPAVSSTK
jgi:hypothetical protein